MLIPVRGGKIIIEPNSDSLYVDITLSDRGGLDGSPPDSLKIKMTLDEVDELMTALKIVKYEALLKHADKP